MLQKNFAWMIPLVVGAALALHAWTHEEAITQEELMRNTQEIFDAVAPGNPEPFRKYFADDAMFFDEKGRDMDKTEIVFGQRLTARYHETDIWMRREGKWQIVAAQVLRYYEDPAPGKADTSKFPGYAGTYQLSPERILTITTDNGRLYEQRNGRQREELIPEASDIFFIKGTEGRTLFGYDNKGKVATLIDRRNNEDIIWTKVK